MSEGGGRGWFRQGKGESRGWAEAEVRAVARAEEGSETENFRPGSHGRGCEGVKGGERGLRGGREGGCAEGGWLQPIV